MAAAPAAHSSSTARFAPEPFAKHTLWLPPELAVKLNLLPTLSACENSTTSLGPVTCKRGGGQRGKERARGGAGAGRAG